MESFHKPTKHKGQNISLKGDHWKMISLQEIHTFDSKIKVVTTLQPHHTLNGVPLKFFSSSRTTRLTHTSGTAPSTTAWTWGWTEEGKDGEPYSC